VSNFDLVCSDFAALYPYKYKMTLKNYRWGTDTNKKEKRMHTVNPAGFKKQRRFSHTKNSFFFTVLLLVAQYKLYCWWLVTCLERGINSARKRNENSVTQLVICIMVYLEIQRLKANTSFKRCYFTPRYVGGRRGRNSSSYSIKRIPYWTNSSRSRVPLRSQLVAWFVKSSY
jgi:hypothetical protein